MQILIIPKDLYCPDGKTSSEPLRLTYECRYTNTWNPIAQNRKNILSTCGTAGLLNHPQYDWSVKFLNASPPKIIFLGLVPPRKPCMRADYDTLHCRLDLLGNFEHLCDIHPARIPYYSTLFLSSPIPNKAGNFFPSQFRHRFFFGLPRDIWTNPTFVPPLLPWQIRHYIAMCIARKQWLWRTPLGCPQLHLSKGWTQTLVAFQYTVLVSWGSLHTPRKSNIDAQK